MRCTLFTILGGLALAVLPAQGAPETASDALQNSNRAAAKRGYEADLRSATNHPDLLVLPGLLADRTGKRIRLLAETTAVKPGDTAEFFLIGENSGHDYEALAVSLARPSDVHNALEFIGMKPGRAANVEKLQLRPKGERVFMTLRPHAGGSNVVAVHVEDLVTDTRENKTLPRSGLVFIGSMLRPANGQTGMVYAADAFEPNSIAASYNESESVLDVPREAPQRDVYGRQVVSAALAFGSNTLVDVFLEPELRDGGTRCIDVTVHAAPAADSPDDLALAVRAGDRTLTADLSLQAALDALMALVRKGHTPFVTLRLDDALTLGSVRALCQKLAVIDADDGICMDAPAPGGLYYRAFLPNEKFRDRAGRIAQPWELRMTLRQGNAEGVLTQIEQVWRDNEVTPDLRIHKYPVATPEILRRELDARGKGLPVILVFAPRRMTCGQLMGFLRPAVKTHPTIHVFVGDSTAVAEAPVLSNAPEPRPRQARDP